MSIEINMEHVGWTLKGRCREVAVSFEHEFAGSVIYGETIKEGRWFYTLPYRKSGGAIEEPNAGNIDYNGKIIGNDLGSAELGEIFSKSISEDYEMLKTIQNIVQQMELIEDISINKMVSGEIYGFEDDGCHSLIISALSEDIIYFLRLDQDGKDYIFADDEDEKVECWPLNCLQSMAEYKPEDFGYDAGTLRGLYYYADTEIYNLPEKLVDYETTEFVSAIEFAERLKLQIPDIIRPGEKKIR